MKKIFIYAFFTCFVFLTTNAAAEKRLFIIDDDNGMDKKGCFRDAMKSPIKTFICDPDGGLELVYMLREPEIEVIGITCTAGCSTLAVCMDADKKLLKLLGREDIPVLAGGAGPKDLGKPSPASEFIIKQVMAHPGKVEILATAPLTNIATAMMAEPALSKTWKTLHFATGEFHGAFGARSDARLLEWAGYKDLNINVDPAATRYVLEHGGAFPVYPNELMDDADITFSDWRELKSSKSSLARYIASETFIFLNIEAGAGRVLGLTGMAVHGLIPAAVAVHPELYAGRTVEGKIQMTKTKRNGFIFKMADEPGLDAHKIYVDMRNADSLKKQFMERFK